MIILLARRALTTIAPGDKPGVTNNYTTDPNGVEHASKYF